MAQQPNPAAQAVSNIYRTPELWQKITFTFLCMVIYRIGAHITALKIGPIEWSFGTGYVSDSENRSGIYGRVGVLTRR